MENNKAVTLKIRNDKGNRTKLYKILKSTVTLCFMMVLFVVSTNVNFAAPINPPAVIKKIELNVVYDGTDIDKGNISISGSNLEELIVDFKDLETGEYYQPSGEIKKTKYNVDIKLNKEEIEKFDGVLRIDGEQIDLGTEQFPTISNIENINVVYDKPVNPDSLVIIGNHLDEIKQNSGEDKVRARYGRKNKEFIYYNPLAAEPDTAGKITVSNLVRPGGKGGFQNIYFDKQSALTIKGETFTPNNPDQSKKGGIFVNYRYNDVFRLLNDLKLNQLEMFPNMGTFGNKVYFTAENFSNGSNYNVYFLKSLTGEDDFKKGINSASEVKPPTIDIDGTTKDRLIVRVPNKNDDFDIGTYYVMIVEEDVDGQIVSQQVVKKQGVDAKYTVVAVDSSPAIDTILPPHASDKGGKTTITGRNILKVDIPELKVDQHIDTFEFKSNDNELIATYTNGTYGENNTPVTVKRKFKVNIGKLATFDRDSYVNNTNIGDVDRLNVTTAVIDNLEEDDEKKDVLIEIETVITEIGTGKEYLFIQEAIKEKAFKFFKSKYTPTIENVSPEKVQVELSGVGYKPKNDTLISIEGKDFLVERIIKDNKTIIRKPKVLFKKDKGQFYNSLYQIEISPAIANNGVGANLNKCIIKYKLKETDPEQILTKNGQPIELEMTVLDDKDRVVDGTKNNDMGTRIVFRLPATADVEYIGDLGIKQIQVINPVKGSTAYEGVSEYVDVFRFVETADNPKIESVEPNIVTLDGDETITVKGINFKEGMKIYLDGKEVSGYEITGDPVGTGQVITFPKPKGRVGTTQLQLINPSGGMAVRNFIYVSAFSNAPTIDNFTPNRATANTLVIVNGENYVQPETSVASESGIDGLRLIGTRVFLDGKDVNNYWHTDDDEIDFKKYTAPTNEYSILVKKSGDLVWSKYYKNADIYRILPNNEKEFYYILHDEKANPMVANRRENAFFFTYNSDDGKYYANKEIEEDLSSTNPNNPINKNKEKEIISSELTIDTTNKAQGITMLSFSMDVDGDGTPENYQFEATIDNNIIRKTQNVNDVSGKDIAELADYVDSVIFRYTNANNINTYYTLKKNMNGNIIFTNGSDVYYRIFYDDNLSSFKAEKNKNENNIVGVSSDDKKITIDGKSYEMITPYKWNEQNRIVGDRTRVLNAGQMAFNVPSLDTGAGYKTLEVVNPDTQKAIKENKQGLYYVAQASSNPIISEIKPNLGSIYGGYSVIINGSGFEEGIRVYIDSVQVPKENTIVGIKSDTITIKVPACTKDLQKDFGVDRLSVPVVVINEDGGSFSDEEGFTYVVPLSEPRIDKIVLEKGSANGGEIVDILGYDFRFFEPYKDIGEADGYDKDDEFTDIYKNGKWDDLTNFKDKNGVFLNIEDINSIKKIKLPRAIAGKDYYYESDILPSVYFGENKAKIVKFGRGFIKVITPKHREKGVPVYVVNNDQGVSNVVSYSYESTVPQIDKINLDKGNRTGQEYKDIYGNDFRHYEVFGYSSDDDNDIVELKNLKANVRFANVDNTNIEIGKPNDGRINWGEVTVKLDGGLTAEYSASDDTIKLQVEENDKTYSRVFHNFRGDALYMPMEMLRVKISSNPDKYEYYHPNGYTDIGDINKYNDKNYEYIKAYIRDKRLFVERGYAPHVEYISKKRLRVISPSYHDIGLVNVTITNSDGGQATAKFTYTNPASKPKILTVNPHVMSKDGKFRKVEAALKSGLQIEVIGKDFRENAKVYIGTKQAEIKKVSTRVVDGKTYDLLLVKVPDGTIEEVDQKMAIIVENEDDGIADSTTLKNLLILSGQTEPQPFYFIYKKPWSKPTVLSVQPSETSAFGGNKLTIIGKDFRNGAVVSISGIKNMPIKQSEVSDDGTKIVVTTPNNMLYGKRELKVINTDFGTGTLEGDFTVVSFPVLESVGLEDNEGSSTVSVEGNQKVIIKGHDFIEGAKVYFGGKRETHNKKIESDTVGLYKDDTYVELIDAVEASGVEFVDSSTLRVTTPEILKEQSFYLTVINADGGISDSDVKIKYMEPVPSRPIGLKARIINDEQIQLYGYTSENVEYYEVYYFLGDKTSVNLTKNDREAMKLLGTTQLEPYKIVDIPNFDRRDDDDQLTFAIKAVNKYGPSSWSNFVTLKYHDLKDIVELGGEDTDGEIGESPNGKYTYKVSGQSSVIDIDPRVKAPQIDIDLRGKSVIKPTERTINIPDNLIRDSNTFIKVDYEDLRLGFIPRACNTKEFREIAYYDKAYAVIKTTTNGNKYKDMINLSIPRGKKAVTNIFTMDIWAKNNDESKTIRELSSPIDLQLLYDDTYFQPEEENTLKLYRYSDDMNKWGLVASEIDKANNVATTRLYRTGSYVILRDR